MTKDNFSYKKCIEKVDEVVSPSETQLPPLEGKNNAMERINQHLRGNLPSVLYRYMPIILRAISSILDEDIYMVPATKMNDAFEGAAYGINSSVVSNQQEIRRIQNEICLKSFSYAKNSNLMWSHYGDAHKGICIHKAGLPDIRFHDLRHTFATHAIASGVDAKTLSGILGHTNASFTLDTYTHVTPDMQKAASGIVGGFMEDLLGKGLRPWQRNGKAEPAP